MENSIQEVKETKSVDWTRRKIRLYLSHPYTGSTTKNVKSSILKMMELLKKDYVVINPLFSHFVDKTVDEKEKLSWEEWMEYDYELLKMCDCMLLCGEWQESRGCLMERSYANLCLIPVLESEDGLQYFKENWNK